VRHINKAQLPKKEELDMQLQQKKSLEKSRKKSRIKEEDALKHVVSLRISDQEKRILERCTEASCKNISQVVREAIDLWLTKNNCLCLES
jgi:hypothetical protein